jgi:FtsZ-interacting cell division protein ZipA
VNAFEMLLIICAVGVLVVIALIVVGFVIALKCRSNKYTRLNDGWDEYLEEQRLQFAADTREQQRLEAQRAAEEREKERQRQRKNFPTKWKRNNNQ